MKRNIVLFIIGTSASLIVIPFLIDWLIIGNNIPSNITNPEWVNFLGSYVGAIVGGIVSLIGIGWTIRFTQKENRADRELQIRPVFDIYCHHCNEVKENWLGYISLNIDADDEEEWISAGAAFIRIKNVGNGPALNIDFCPSVVGLDHDNTIYFNNCNEEVTTQALMPGEQAGLTIDEVIRKSVPSRKEYDEIDSIDQKLKYHLPTFSIEVIIRYDDLLSNHFCQRILFEVNSGLSFEKTEKGKISSNINIINIDMPQKIEGVKHCI